MAEKLAFQDELLRTLDSKYEGYWELVDNEDNILELINRYPYEKDTVVIKIFLKKAETCADYCLNTRGLDRILAKIDKQGYGLRLRNSSSFPQVNCYTKLLDGDF